MYDYNWAIDYLSRGRKKYIRPLYDRGLYIFKEEKWNPNSDIHVAWRGGPAFVVYHPDNTTTIQCETQTTTWGGVYNFLHGQGTRFTIARYANLERVFMKNHKPYITELDAGLTPSKIQGCRTCKQTGLVDSWCYSRICYNMMDSANLCSEHGRVAEELLLTYGNRHRLPCPHGKLDGHSVPRDQQCFSCLGVRKREYGLKKISLAWDGSPLRLKDGKVIKTPISNLERMVADYVRKSDSGL